MHKSWILERVFDMERLRSECPEGARERNNQNDKLPELHEIVFY
jgi:hypothetical protein